MATPIIQSSGSTSGVGTTGQGRDDLVIGETVTLSDTEALNSGASYSWEFVDIPIDSSATLNNPLTATPDFSPDETGSYWIRCTVDGTDISTEILAVSLTTTSARIPAFQEQTEYDGAGNAKGWHTALTKFMRNADAAFSADGYANVKDYGATGDGATDDRVAIQAAFDALSDTDLAGVFFPPGTYRVTLATAINAVGGRTSDIHVRGVPGQSSMQVLAGDQGSTNYKVLDFNTGTGNCVVESMIIDGNNANTTNESTSMALLRHAGDDFYVINCEFKDCGGEAIQFASHDDIQVRDCNFSDIDRDCLSGASAMNRVTVANCNFTSPVGGNSAGFDFGVGGSDFVISNCRVLYDSTSGYGILSLGSSSTNAKITNCIFQGRNTPGAISGAHIDNCEFLLSSTGNVATTFAGSNSLLSNCTFDGGNISLRVTGDNNTVVGCRIGDTATAFGDSAIEFEDCSGGALLNSYIAGQSTCGLAIETTTGTEENFRVEGNTFDGEFDQHAIYFVGSGAATLNGPITITGNHFINPKAGVTHAIGMSLGSLTLGFIPVIANNNLEYDSLIDSTEIANFAEGCIIMGGGAGQMASATAADNSATQFLGTGTPEAAITGYIGDTYLRIDGSSGTTLYVKESGAGTNTGWVAIGTGTVADPLVLSTGSPTVNTTGADSGLVVAEAAGSGGTEAFNLNQTGMVFGEVDANATSSGTITQNGLGAFAGGAIYSRAASTSVIEATSPGSIALGHISSTGGGAGQIRAITAEGAFARGHVSSAATAGTAKIEANDEGTHASGYVRATGAFSATIIASDLGAFAHGGVRNGTIEATGRGCVAFGYANHSSSGATARVLSEGYGSIAGGYAWVGSANDIAEIKSGQGGFAWGKVTANNTMNGYIHGAQEGAFAQGHVEADGTLTDSYIRATIQGAFAQGEVQDNGRILASGTGSFAKGYAWSGSGNTTGSFIRATAGGAFACGVATDDGDIFASGDGAHASGGCAGSGSGGLIQASSAGSFAHGYTAPGAGGVSDLVAGGIGALAFGLVQTTTTGTAYITAGDASADWGAFAGGVSFAGTGEYAAIRAGGKGSFAFGYAKDNIIEATVNNSWQFGVGSNDLVDSLQVGVGWRFKATQAAPGAPLDGDAWIAIGTAATGVLTLSSNAANTETVVIGDRTYTWESAFSDTANFVLIGGTASDSIDNLIAAINNGAGEGTTYGTGTVQHAQVSAAAGAGDTMDVSATVVNANAIATTETMGSGSWGDVTLVNGLDDLLLRTGGASENLSTVSLQAAAANSMPPEKWFQDNVAASQSNVDLGTRVSGQFVNIKAIRSGSIIGLSTRYTETLTDTSNDSALVTVTINGTPGTLQITHKDTVNEDGGVATQAAGVDTFSAGDTLGIEITTLGSFTPTTTDLEAWMELKLD